MESPFDARRTDSVACPKCRAKPGEPCVTPSGGVRRDYPHLARKKEWEKVRALVPLAVKMARRSVSDRGTDTRLRVPTELLLTVFVLMFVGALIAAAAIPA